MIFQDSLGIDITRSSLSLVFLKNSITGMQLAAGESFALDPEQPTPERVRTAAGKIREFMGENGISATDIHLAIPGELAILRHLEFPLAVKENLRETLRYEMEKYIPLPVEDILFDCQILAENRAARTISVLLVVVKKTDAAPYLELPEKLGAGFSSMEITPTALVNFPGLVQPSGPYAIVFTRGGRADICLARNGLLLYATSQPIPEQQETLAQLLLDSLRAGTQILKDPPVPLTVIPCGTRIDNTLLADLRKDSRFTWQPLAYQPEGLPSHDLLPAYGLALKGLRKVAMQANLLPVAMRKKPSKAGIYTLIVLAALAIILGLTWAGSHIARQRMTFDRLDAEVKRLAGEMATVDRIKKDTQKLSEQIAYLSSIETLRPSSVEILRELTDRMPESAWLTDFTLSEKGVQISGQAISASELIPLLEDSPLFKDVLFNSAITKTKDGNERFRIGFALQ